MTKKIKAEIILVAGLIVSLTVIATVSLQVISHNKTKDSKLKSDVDKAQLSKASGYGVEFQYPLSMSVLAITEKDVKDRIFFRAKNRENADYLVTIRAETGLAAPARLGKQTPLELAVNGATASLPSRYPDSKILSSNDFVVNQLPAHELIFSYTGPSGQIIKQKIVLAIVGDETGIYFSSQSKIDDFDGLDRNVFSYIKDSLKAVHN